MHTFGAHFAEVAVDTRTGKVEILRLVAAHDVGRVINRLGCENQIQGGAVMGIGFGLLERQHIDGHTGICVNPNMVDFKIPSILDVPVVEPIIVESDDPTGPSARRGSESLPTAFRRRPLPMPSTMRSVCGSMRSRSTSSRSSRDWKRGRDKVGGRMAESRREKDKREGSDQLSVISNQ